MKKFLFGDTLIGSILKCIVNLVILNFLWIVCSIPLITIGASTTALYSSIRALNKGEEQMTHTFFEHLKRNFKQSTILWILAAIIGFAMYWGIYIVSFWEHNRSAALMFFSIPCILYLMILNYAFPLLAEFETTLPQLFSNSILLSIGHFPRSILIVLISLMPVFAIYVLPSWIVCAIFLWLPIGFALCAFVISKLLNPVFAPFRPKEPELPKEN